MDMVMDIMLSLEDGCLVREDLLDAMASCLDRQCGRAGRYGPLTIGTSWHTRRVVSCESCVVTLISFYTHYTV